MLKEALEQLPYVRKMKEFYGRYERFLVPAVLLLGFLFDIITFKSIDVLTAFALLGVHLGVVMVSIVFVNLCDNWWYASTSRFLHKLRLFAILAMQFSFGALLSAAFIFYSFGGTISGSWPFIVLLLFLMVANEVFKKFYLRPVVQISVLFFVLYVFFSLVFPYVFTSISAWFFVLSGVTAIVVISLYIRLLYKMIPEFRRHEFFLSFTILSITVLLNSMYFFNVIPPVPVSLVDAGVYHNLEHTGNVYNISQEKEPWWEKIVPGIRLHVNDDESLYAFTSVFAPSKLQATVVHHWQKKNPATGEWESRRKLSYNISGGRKDGYRGYSVLSNLEKGEWRVRIETQRGQVFGILRFTIDPVTKERVFTSIQK